MDLKFSRLNFKSNRSEASSPNGNENGNEETEAFLSIPMESNTPLSFKPVKRGAKTKSSEAILRRRKGEWKPKYLAKIEEERNLVAQNDELNERLVRLELKMRKWNLKWLVLGLFLGWLALGCLALVFIVIPVTVNSKDELLHASMLRQQSVNGLDDEIPRISTSTLPLRTTTTTTSTTTTTAAPTTYKHWDWRTNCGVQPLNHTGSFGVWPWQVLVKETKYLGDGVWENQNMCGGVLLNSKFVLTAAHCLSSASFLVGLGDYHEPKNYEPKSEVTLQVKEKVFVHPDYVAGTFDNDLALMELDSPVTFQEHILPICLPPVENNYAGNVATVAGWGSLRHGDSLTERLQEVQLHIITNSECQDWFKEKGKKNKITSELMCAGYRNSCEGDSGGPLTLRGPDGRWVLVGAVSQGIKCAKPILPGVYMRMSHYRPWIEDIINA